MLDQGNMHVDDVTNRNKGKLQPVWLASFGIDATGTRCSLTSTKNVSADHEVLCGIESFPRSNKAVSPPGLATIDRVLSRDVRVACQRMADENRVILFRR